MTDRPQPEGLTNENKERELMDRHEDVNLEGGAHQHTGHVDYADPKHERFPIGTPDQIQQAWQAVNDRRQVGDYDKDELDRIRARVRDAAKEHDIQLYLRRQW